MGAVSLGRKRIAVDQRVRNCTKCPRGARDRQVPLEIELGQRARFAVVLESPGTDDDKMNRVTGGAAARELRRLFAKAGIDYREVAWMWAVACLCEPVVSVYEMQACRGNLMKQLEAADVRYVLLVGAKASLEWRTDLNVTELEGHMGILQSRWLVAPVREAGAVLRIDHGRGAESELWRKAVYQLVEAATDDRGINVLGYGCMMKGCIEPMFAYDIDGLPWCRNHHAKGMKGAEASRRRWKVKDAGQGALAIPA